MTASRYRIIIIGTACLVFLTSPIAAGSTKKDSTVYLAKMDTSYLFDYKNMLTARVFLLYQPAILNYQLPGFDDVRLKPNVPLKIGIAAFYKWFGLGLSIYSPFVVFDNDKYGKTTQIDLRLNFISNRWILEGYLQLTKGLYIDNYQGAGDTYYATENADMLSLGANAYWILNHKRFSTRSVFNNNEQQKKSAGSFMVQIQASYQTVTADSGILDSRFIDDYGLRKEINPTDIQTVYLGVSPGYSYTLVFLKKMYLNGGLFPGLMWSYAKYDYENSFHDEWSMFPFMGIRAAIGFNSAKWHAGFSAISKVHGLSVSGDSPFYYDAPQFRIWVGTRFEFLNRKKKKNGTFEER